MKTAEELNALKEEVENLNKKLAELTKEELKQVSRGNLFITSCPLCGGELGKKFDYHSDNYTLICLKCGYEVPYY